MLASMFNAPNMALDDDEAEKLSKAIANVTRHYDVPGMSQKSVDWIMAIQAGGSIYGTRLLAWRMERATKAVKPAPQNPNAPANVGPSASAPGARPMAQEATPNIHHGQRLPTPMPGNETTRQPQHAPVNGPVRQQQPGLAHLDGADLPIKFNS